MFFKKYLKLKLPYQLNILSYIYNTLRNLLYCFFNHKVIKFLVAVLYSFSQWIKTHRYFGEDVYEQRQDWQEESDAGSTESLSQVFRHRDHSWSDVDRTENPPEYEQGDHCLEKTEKIKIFVFDYFLDFFIWFYSVKKEMLLLKTTV